MGHVEATTTAPRVKGPESHPKIGHWWMKFTSTQYRKSVSLDTILLNPYVNITMTS